MCLASRLVIVALLGRVDIDNQLRELIKKFIGLVYLNLSAKFYSLTGILSTGYPWKWVIVVQFTFGPLKPDSLRRWST